MKIERTDFIKEVVLALKDEFVAEIKEDGEKIFVRFLNGQTFQLTVEND